MKEIRSMPVYAINHVQNDGLVAVAAAAVAVHREMVAEMATNKEYYDDCCDDDDSADGGDEDHHTEYYDDESWLVLSRRTRSSCSVLCGWCLRPSMCLYFRHYDVLQPALSIVDLSGGPASQPHPPPHPHPQPAKPAKKLGNVSLTVSNSTSHGPEQLQRILAYILGWEAAADPSLTLTASRLFGAPPAS